MDQETLTASISVIGELSNISPQDILPFFDTLMPYLINSLRDNAQTLQKKEASVRALGLVSRATGRVIEPYLTHPKLFRYLKELFIQMYIYSPT